MLGALTIKNKQPSINSFSLETNIEYVSRLKKRCYKVTHENAYMPIDTHLNHNAFIKKPKALRRY